MGKRTSRTNVEIGRKQVATVGRTVVVLLAVLVVLGLGALTPAGAATAADDDVAISVEPSAVDVARGGPANPPAPLPARGTDVNDTIALALVVLVVVASAVAFERRSDLGRSAAATDEPAG